VTGLQTGRLGFDSQQGRHFFSLRHRVQTDSGASYPVHTEAISLGVKRSGREARHSLPSSAEAKNAWNYTSTPKIRLHGVVLRHGKNFISENYFDFYVYGQLNDRLVGFLQDRLLGSSQLLTVTLLNFLITY
jgi:hypothetical protein